jgi:MIP family channel proteins
VKGRAFAAEFIGTFALIFVGMMAIATDAIYHDMGRVGIALAHGLTIAVMASATMAVSGGHLNPAVTFGMWMGKRITLKRTVGYWGAQLAGGIVGAFMANACMPADMLVNTNYRNASYGLPSVAANLVPMGGGLPMIAILIETILTFFLMYVILGTAADNRAPRIGGLYIGLAVTLDILAGGPLTGAAMNPARWFGPALLVSTQQGGNAIAWANWPVYIVGPLLGATIAGIAYGRPADSEDEAEAEKR